MIKISKNKKTKLNKLLSYYRHKLSKSEERYLPKNFIYDNEGLEICTVYTLSRIEHNKTLSYDNIYYALLDNLNMSYTESSKIDELIHTINLSILKFAEINDAKNIVSRINKTMNTLAPYFEYVIYHEQAEIYEIILDYYSDYKFNIELIDKHIALFDLVDEPLKPILIEIGFIFYTRIYLDPDKSYYPLTLIKKCNCNSVISDYVLLLLYFREYKLINEKALGDKLIQRCKNENNKIYLCKSYNILSSLYTKQNPDLAMHYLQLAIKEFDLINDTKYNLAIYKRNLGILACMNEQYELSVESFDSLNLLQPDLLLITFPYFIFALEKTNYNELVIIKILLDFQINKSKINDRTLLLLLDLWLIKYKINNKLNLYNIVSEFIEEKNTLITIQPILHIIESCLFDICKEKHTFNLYKDFMKNLH
ncbi:MAG: hypothetical protein PHQ89_03435 [Bacilli bacterium]|nr:hypothetical protein [Bacilli bacterium]